MGVEENLKSLSISEEGNKNPNPNLSIGKQWKELLDCNDTIGFIFHEDAKKLDKAAKNRPCRETEISMESWIVEKIMNSCYKQGY
ncbi:hypothetical protein QQP08_019721 [Theobroma cacao]|nr:hypothetical protein QQP08_019721 [Theobroma cacao]